MDYNNPNYGYPTEFRPPPPATFQDGGEEEITPENAMWDQDTRDGTLQQDQYLPWNQQQQQQQHLEQPQTAFGVSFDSPSSSSRTTRPNPLQSHSLRYEPYQIPSNSHTLPHVPHSLNQPDPFPQFDLADPSFLLPASDGTLKDWQGARDADRRDSNSSTQHSRESGEGSRKNSDPVVGSTATTSNPHGAKRQINEGLPTFVGYGGEAGATEQSGVSKKVVKKADKSCRKCRYGQSFSPQKPSTTRESDRYFCYYRDRRVRCDRIFPVCDRCRKRRETCAYVDNVNVDEFEEGGDAQKVVDLQSKVAALEKQLKTMGSNPSPADESSSSAISPTERRKIDGSPSSGNSSSNASGSNPSRTPPGNVEGTSSSIVSGIGDIYTNQLRFKPDEMENLTSYLMGRSISFANLGHSNPNWRLGEPAVIKQLTIHLMDGQFCHYSLETSHTEYSASLQQLQLELVVRIFQESNLSQIVSSITNGTWTDLMALHRLSRSPFHFGEPSTDMGPFIVCRRSSECSRCTSESTFRESCVFRFTSTQRLIFDDLARLYSVLLRPASPMEHLHLHCSSTPESVGKWLVERWSDELEKFAGSTECSKAQIYRISTP